MKISCESRVWWPISTRPVVLGQRVLWRRRNCSALGTRLDVTIDANEPVANLGATSEAH